ncbi:MAG TPA: ABC transporter substrate-binding protein [Thermomicrobiales bacterium]|nr:ABC transporter substrate-binding protein [Thermomicrobiales bacterium]
MGTTRRQLIVRGSQLAAGAALAPAFLTLSPRASLAQDKVTIDFPYLWTGPEGEAMQKIADDFNASQGEVEVKGVSNPDQQRQLAAMASSNGFDISDGFDNQIGTWADNGAIQALDDFISGSSYDTSDFIPSVLEKMSFDGKTYALPVAVHTTLLLHNTTLLEEAGVEPPKTTSELAAAIEALTKVDGNGAIQQLGMQQPDFVSFAYSFGGQWIDDQNQPTANHEGNIAALQFWVDNVLNKYGADNVKRFQSGFGEYASPQNPFYTGKVAMVTDGEWQARFTQQYAPDLKWTAAPIPVPDDKPELEGTSSIASSIFFIPSNASDADAAWAFMQYVMSPDAMRDFTVALANLPTRQSLLKDKAYEEIPGMHYWLESLSSKNLKAMPNVPWGQEYGTEITSTIDEVINLNKTPEQALNELQEKAKGLAG